MINERNLHSQIRVRHCVHVCAPLYWNYSYKIKVAAQLTFRVYLRAGTSQPSHTAGRFFGIYVSRALSHTIMFYIERLQDYTVESLHSGTCWGILTLHHFRATLQVVELLPLLQLAGLCVVALLPLASAFTY